MPSSKFNSRKETQMNQINSSAGKVEILNAEWFGKVFKYEVVWYDHKDQEKNRLKGSNEPPDADKLNSIEKAFNDAHAEVAQQLKDNYQNGRYI